MTNNKKNENLKQHVLKYLSDTLNSYTTYHNHKEKSAWGALVIFILFIHQIILLINTQSIPQKVLATIICIFVTFFIFKYINTQFQLRRESAYINTACHILTIKYLVDSEEIICKEDFQITRDCNSEFLSDYYLPDNINNIAQEISENEKGQKALKKLEFFVRFLLILAFLAAELIIWFK